MSRRKAIIWVDDNPDRGKTAKLLEESSKFPVHFKGVKNEDVAIIVNEMLTDTQPALVILDHILDKTSTTNALFHRGSTIAEAIKEKWPACPVIGVTNADGFSKIDLRTKYTYDGIFPFTNFGRYFDRIDTLAEDFAVIAARRPKKAGDVAKLLKAPDDDAPQIALALPSDIRAMPTDGSIGSRLYKWMQQLLIGRPGFLYDELWAATFLGLSESGFKKVKSMFEKACYGGLFATDSEPRWWKSSLASILYKKQTPAPGELSWHLGRRLPRITKSDFSKCLVCKKDFPDVVAFLDRASDERAAMHSGCTQLDTRFTRELYFEDMRIMSGD